MAATVEPVVRHHVVSVPQRTPEHGRGAGSSVGVEARGSSYSRLMLVAPARQHDGLKFGGKSKRCPVGEPERMAWCYAHAEGSGATSQDRGKVAGRRGSHNDSTLAS